MLNLLLSNRLAALFLLLASIGVQRHKLPASVAGPSLARGIALAAWSIVLAGFIPAFQVVFRFPESSLVAFDSRVPIGWLLVSLFLVAIGDRCFCQAAAPASGAAPSLQDCRFSLAALVAAMIADPRFPVSGFLTGGIHQFQPWEGIAGLVFLLYPMGTFSGRMGTVGATLGSGLFALGFGAIPAAMLYSTIQEHTGHVRIGSLLGIAALSCVLLSGFEGLGNLARSWSGLLATGSFILLHHFGSRRSTEVRAS